MHVIYMIHTIIPTCLICLNHHNDFAHNDISDRSWLECGSWKRESSDVYQMFRNYEI